MSKNSKKCLAVFRPLRISEDPQSFKGKGPGDPFRFISYFEAWMDHPSYTKFCRFICLIFQKYSKNHHLYCHFLHLKVPVKSATCFRLSIAKNFFFKTFYFFNFFFSKIHYFCMTCSSFVTNFAVLKIGGCKVAEFRSW